MLWGVGVLLCLWARDYPSNDFATVDSDSSLPHIVIPFYPHMNDIKTLAQEFADNADSDREYAVGLIDCSRHPSVCADKKLVPGKMSLSVPPFNKLKVSNRPLTEEGLTHASEDLTVSNVHQLRSLQDVEKLAKRANLFAIVARDNAGDLEMKIPILKELASRLVHYNVVFGIARDPAVYEKFAEYPLTAFVRITGNLEYEPFKGDFTLSRLADFVVEHCHKPWSHWDEQTGVAIVRVARKLDSSEYVDLEATHSLVFVNSSSEQSLANTRCGGRTSCDAVVDFKTCRALRIPDGANVTEFFDEFDEEFGKLPLFDKVKCGCTLGVYVYRNVCIVFGGVAVVFLVILVLSCCDTGLEVEDKRVKGKKKVK